MDKPNILIPIALEYYDNNIEKYEKFVKKVKNIDFQKSQSDLEHNKITFIDKNNNKIYTSRYENIGIYSTKENIWTWAWSVPVFEKNSIFLIKKMLNYGIDLNDNVFLKGELITSRFKISNKYQLDIHLALASYICKQQMIFIIKNNSNMDKPLFGSNIDFEEIDEDLNSVYYFLFILDFENILEK